ncbi:MULTISPECIES: asparaginase domain-containing protein [unclassified Lentimicrobium]|uniref:asparaginase domain-containing protein n=1 Tax=unclassified Lentimicrobium TaxID=2677434 RepID=UPI00155376CE|nr:MULTISPECIES: asparaginase domain-containing protein [unclassified Lentimicrobium]NPD46011.1 asparaginase [Lentimicrobium sp. S6]NPD85211.1 asparaginase [Lentimicrobium sp. L6]
MNIAFIQTGGTIDKDYPHSIKGWAFEIGSPAFIEILKNAQHQHEISFYEFCKKDSMELTLEDRSALKEKCIALQEKAIIITHGSDTLIETAQVLSSISNKTIILTAAMLPEKFKDSDAAFNLGMAVAGVQSLEPGLYIAIHGYLAHWNSFERDMETGKYLLI